jgi:hypothetical protein
LATNRAPGDADVGPLLSGEGGHGLAPSSRAWGCPKPAVRDGAGAVEFMAASPMESGFTTRWFAASASTRRYYQRFAASIESMVLQSAGLLPVPWQAALHKALLAELDDRKAPHEQDPLAPPQADATKAGPPRMQSCAGQRQFG